MPQTIPTDLLLSFLTSAGSSGLAGLIGAIRQAQLGQIQAGQDQVQKARIDQQITDLQNPDYQSLIDAMSRNLSKSLQTQGANNAMSGLSANSRAGTRASGVAKARENQISADATAQLAQIMQQDKLQREQIISNLLNSDVYRSPDPGKFSIFGDGLLGLLSGVSTGAANGINSAILSGFFDQKNLNNQAPPTPGVDQNPNTVAMNPNKGNNLNSYGIDPSYLSYLFNSGLSGLLG